MSTLSVHDLQGISAHSNTVRVPSGNKFHVDGELKIPSYTTANRPSLGSGEAGNLIWNSSLQAVQVWTGSAWNLLGDGIGAGSFTSPFLSPLQAANFGAPNGEYWFQSSTMSSPVFAEYRKNYYESRSWIKVFQSAVSSPASTNLIDNGITMAGLLVQRNSLDIRAAVYWSTPISYDSVSGSGNNNADSGYSPRRVILGYEGGHGIYNTAQSKCSWGDSSGAVGAGWTGSTCGSFPNDLKWGTGQSGSATYLNISGTWSHWITWNDV